MKLSDLQEEWKKDSVIDDLNLGKESTRVPVLHSKYITFLSNAKLKLRKAEHDYYALRRLKYRYYRGELTQEELNENSWVQYQGNKPLKNEMDEFLNCDNDLIDYEDKIEYFRTIVYTLEQIIRSLNSRTWDIKSAIEWHKFTNGMV